MVVDTSVLPHVAFKGKGWQDSLRFLASQPSLSVPAPVLIEAHAVLIGRGAENPESLIDALLETLEAKVVSIGKVEADLARQAYGRYGKGHHRAALNFGDVMSYAVAAARAEPLAFVGDDFDQTDLEAVRLPLPRR